MAFGRLVWYIMPPQRLTWRSLWCPPRWITPIFLSFDVLSFLVQLAGISKTGSAFDKNVSSQDRQNMLDSGMRTLKLGLVVQLVCFGTFAVIGTRFLHISRDWNAPEDTPFGYPYSSRWRRLSWMINGAATLITVCTKDGLMSTAMLTATISSGQFIAHLNLLETRQEINLHSVGICNRMNGCFGRSMPSLFMVSPSYLFPTHFTDAYSVTYFVLCIPPWHVSPLFILSSSRKQEDSTHGKAAADSLPTR
jgi:hypothetical protein